MERLGADGDGGGVAVAPEPDAAVKSAGRCRTQGKAYWGMKKIFLWLDEHLEPTVMHVAYVIMALIVFEQVVLRFVFKTQVAWSTGVSVYMFIWVTWMGASYNVRKRSHLSFGEIRARLPYPAQFACMVADAVLWISMAVVVIYYSVEQIFLLRDNFALVPGTSDMMQWWFYTSNPIGWGLIIYRALQNLRQDISTFRRREPFAVAAVAMSE